MSIENPEITIEPASLADKIEIDLLVKKCGKHVRDYFGIRNLEEFYKSGYVWIIRESQIIAFAVAVPLKKSQVISLYEIGVDPDHQKKGHAKRLLQHIQEIYPDRDYHFVVNETNFDGRAAYKRMGFKVDKYDITKSGRCIVRMFGRI